MQIVRNLVVPVKHRIHAALMAARDTEDQLAGVPFGHVRGLLRHRVVVMQTAVVTQLAASVPTAALSEYDKVFADVWLVSLGIARVAAALRNRAEIL